MNLAASVSALAQWKFLKDITEAASSQSSYEGVLLQTCNVGLDRMNHEQVLLRRKRKPGVWNEIDRASRRADAEPAMRADR